jgi:hypothetical protein
VSLIVPVFFRVFVCGQRLIIRLHRQVNLRQSSRQKHAFFQQEWIKSGGTDTGCPEPASGFRILIPLVPERRAAKFIGLAKAPISGTGGEPNFEKFELTAANPSRADKLARIYKVRGVASGSRSCAWCSRCLTLAKSCSRQEDEMGAPVADGVADGFSLWLPRTRTLIQREGTNWSATCVPYKSVPEKCYAVFGQEPLQLKE